MRQCAVPTVRRHTKPVRRWTLDAKLPDPKKSHFSPNTKATAECAGASPLRSLLTPANIWPVLNVIGVFKPEEKQTASETRLRRLGSVCGRSKIDKQDSRGAGNNRLLFRLFTQYCGLQLWNVCVFSKSKSVLVSLV